MARLASQEKMQYYPTPLARIDDIVPVIAPLVVGTHYRLLDPCCGEGIALAHLQARLKERYPNVSIQTWGIELNQERAAAADRRLDHVINAPFEVADFHPGKRHKPASLVLLNPPYDYAIEGGRMEDDFLQRVLGWMEPGALLIYIVPHGALGMAAAHALNTNFSDVQVYRFPDEDGPGGFAAFKQLVILGSRSEKDNPYSYEKNRVLEAQLRRDIEIEFLPMQPKTTKLYPLPAAHNARLFRRSYRPDEIIEACQADDLCSQASAWLYPSNAQMPDPLMPPRDGHIAMLVASGIMGTLVAGGQAFKGAAVKTTVVEKPERGTEVVRDVYTTHISKLSPVGLTHYTQPDRVAEFLKEHADTFRDHIRSTFKPYGNTITPAETAILDTVSLDKKLPGRKKAGLLPAQRQSAVALNRSLDRYRVAHLIAMMGYGKTRVALASIELRRAYPALVTCPPHLVDQWAEEAKAALPNVQAVVAESITDLEALRAAYQPGDKLIVVIATSKAKLGPGWHASYPIRRRLPAKDHRTDRFRKAAEAYRKNPTQENRKNALQTALAAPVCPECGHELIDGWSFSSKPQLDKKPGHCRHRFGSDRWDNDEKEWKPVPCSSATFQFAPTISRRWPLADYICRKMRGFFKLHIADEVHKHKAQSSNTGASFQQLVNLLPTITLTGTFFGGPASSIFYLLYRTQKNVRDAYRFNGEREWVNHFGVIERVYKTNGEVEDFSATTTLERRLSSVKEKPGISPGVIRYILPTTVFGQLADLQVALPPYHEDVATLDLGHTYGHIDAFQKDTWSKMIASWPTWTSAWLQWNLARPNSQFRNEVIEDFYPDEDLELPAMIDDDHPFLPKEEWLGHLVRSEIAQGRKVVIYPRQTGTRDIRQRLVEVLQRAGIHGIAVLDSKVGTRRRRQWLADNAKPVLITNPRLVETGMNLHDYGYCSIIFYEVEYSLYTLWQAMCRVHRPGQLKEVRVWFSQYAGTIEEKALALIGKKMLAGQLLYGEDVSGALVEDNGDNSIVLELIEAIRSGEDLKTPEVLFSVPSGDLVTDSPLGSPTVRSKQILTIDDWLKRHGLTRAEAIRKKSRPKNKLPKTDQLKAAGQMTLF